MKNYNYKKITYKTVKELLNPKNLLEFNREIKSSHVKKMSKSIKKAGLLRDALIGDISEFDMRRKFAIIDGQHLLSAIYNDKPIDEVPVKIKKYYSKKEVIDDVAVLNNTQKSWNDTDYLNSWYSFGSDNEHFEAYQKLHYLHNNKFKDIPVGLLVEIYSLNKSKNLFREGKLVFPDESKSHKIAHLILEIRNRFNKNGFSLTGFLYFCKQEKNIDFKKLESRVFNALRNKEDEYCNGREDFKSFIETVYKRL